MDSIHRHHDAVEVVGTAGVDQRVYNGCRIGEAGGLDCNAPEPWQFACLPLAKELVDRIQDIAAHRAADAAVLRQHGILDRLLDQQVIQRPSKTWGCYWTSRSL
jgi:hypothetical protein